MGVLVELNSHPHIGTLKYRLKLAFTQKLSSGIWYLVSISNYFHLIAPHDVKRYLQLSHWFTGVLVD